MIVVGVGTYLYSTGGLLKGLTKNTGSVVIQEVKKLNQLVTVRYTLQRVVGLTEPKEPLGEESILIMVEGQVLAGVNLAELHESDIQFTGQHSVAIHLPEAKLLNVFLDEKQTRIWDRHITWWTPWVPYDPDLEHKARLVALDDVRTAAVKMGILNEAQRNAGLTIVQFLKAFGIEAAILST